LPDPTCRLIFLGGIGEVGRNMACLEVDGRLLIIDVGCRSRRPTCPASTWSCPT
jgi:ribonuclease J